MGNVTFVGQPTLNRNQQSRELEALTGALEQRARNRELGGGQRAKLPLRLEGRGQHSEDSITCAHVDRMTGPGHGGACDHSSGGRKGDHIGKDTENLQEGSEPETLRGGTLEQLEARSGAGLGIVDSVL